VEDRYPSNAQRRGLSPETPPILLEPLAVAPEARVEASRRLDVAARAEVLGELGVELEHVGELVGSGESERAVGGGRDGVVVDFLTQNFSEPRGLCPIRKS
jgi:hypothetical protein